MSQTSEDFGSRMIEEVGYYVYALVDPRTSLPFYIGKGKGGRVFSHEMEAGAESLTSDKIETIRRIQGEGNEVQKLILRHGLTEKESLLTESRLIDFLRRFDFKLDNIALGHHTSAFGIMTTDEVRRKYMAPPLEELGEGCVVVNINRSYRTSKKSADFYEVTRGSWVIADWRIPSLKFALSEYRGFVVEVFAIEPDGWTKVDKRRTFTGKVAEGAVRGQYFNRRLPKKRGAANPISYNLNTTDTSP